MYRTTCNSTLTSQHKTRLSLRHHKTASQDDIAQLQADPNVKSVTEDPKRYRHKHARRELLECEGQAKAYGIDMVQADLAWEAGLTGAGIKVCVIDTGIELGHPDFDSAEWTGDSLSTDPVWYEDTNGHGTHVSGIITASDNGLGLVGVAPKAMIHTVKVFDEFGFVFASSLVDAAYRCRDAGADIISMSWEELRR
jgi:serine protease